MDEMTFLASVFAELSQSRSLDYRLPAALVPIKKFLSLNTATIKLISTRLEQTFIFNSDDAFEPDLNRLDGLLDFDTDSTIIASADIGERFVLRQHALCLCDPERKNVFGVDLFISEDMEAQLRFARTATLGGFQKKELETMQMLAIYIRVAIYQSLYYQPTPLLDDRTERLLASFHIGMLSINNELEILARSSLAEKLLDNCPMLACVGGKLTAASTAQQNALVSILRELVVSDNNVYRFLNNDDSGTGNIVAISRCTGQGIENLFRDVQFNVFIFFANDETVAADVLADIWRVSAAEKRILSAMLKYDNAKKVAMELDVSVNTVKAQLKSVYRKMGIVSKAMLVKKLYSVRSMEALINDS